MITWNFFKYLIANIKYTRIIKKIIKNENLVENFSKVCETKFKLDWIGRMYTVLNPNLMKNESNTTIYELTDNGLDNTEYVRQWIMQKLLVTNEFIKANNLFDILTYKLTRIDENDNFLFIIEPITLDPFKNYLKKFIILWGTIGFLALITYIILNKF